MQWHERNLAKWNEKYGKPKPLTPLWMQQDSFPDWLKAKRIKTPQDAELQHIIARSKESEGDGVEGITVGVGDYPHQRRKPICAIRH